MTFATASAAEVPPPEPVDGAGLVVVALDVVALELVPLEVVPLDVVPLEPAPDLLPLLEQLLSRTTEAASPARAWMHGRF